MKKPKKTAKTKPINLWYVFIPLAIIITFGVTSMLLSSKKDIRENPWGVDTGKVKKLLNNKGCGIENCHGLDISCGPNVAQACTMMYQIGDGCRQYASCEISEDGCSVVESPRFTECKSCVETCMEMYGDNDIDLFTCESNCVL